MKLPGFPPRRHENADDMAFHQERRDHQRTQSSLGTAVEGKRRTPRTGVRSYTQGTHSRIVGQSVLSNWNPGHVP